MASTPIGALNSPLPLADASGKPDNARIHDVARKLEGQFAQMMIKCMREAGFGDSLFPGENQVFRDMYDQQIAKAMSEGRGLGLAPMIARQLGATDSSTPAVPASTALSAYKRLLPGNEADSMLDAIAGRGIGNSATRHDTDMPATITLDAITVRPDAACDEVEQVASADPSKYARNTPERFVAEIWDHARQAAKELGVDPRALVAQAALETGWGRRLVGAGEGATSHNLFGIKATGWEGERARTATHEYSNGVKHSETADFRAYASPAESFADYARLMRSQRYTGALAAGGDCQRYAQALQRAGYATDPAYAAKITAIAEGPTLRRALAALDDTTGPALAALPGNPRG